MKDSNWDLDLRAGETGESMVADLLHIDSVEVKTDRRWHETGNIYIETSCYYVGDKEWKPSGLSVSKATHWAFVLEDSVLIIPLHRLKAMVYDEGVQVTCEIPPNLSKGYLIKPTALLEYIRSIRNIEIAEHGEEERRRVYG